MARKWFIDVSHWNPLSEAQYVKLMQEGCGGVCIKAGQGILPPSTSLVTHATLADKLKLPKALYYWADPIVPADKQVDLFVAQAIKHNPKWLAVDIEQYWSDWDAWRKIVVEKQPGILPQLSSDQILKHSRQFLQKLRLKTKLPIIVYSATWFINSYCRPLTAVIEEFADGFWNAAYVKWTQIDADPNVSWPEFHKTLEGLDLSKMPLPKGYADWDIWQFAILPMSGFPKLDINFIHDASYADFFGKAPAKPPTMTVAPAPATGVGSTLPPSPAKLSLTVEAQELNIREKPSAGTTKILGKLKKGDKIAVEEIAGQDAWVRHEKGWSAAQVKDKVYLKK